MPARQHQSVSRASKTAVIAGAGVAGLAALFVTPPAALAAPAPAGDRVAPADTTETSSASSTSSAPVEPRYGYQKYRVGVQGKNGDYFPDKTSTAGTTFAVTVTPQEGKAETTTCTSVANTPDDVEDPTLCPGDGKYAPLPLRRAASVAKPSDDLDHTYLAEPGDTITVTQTTVEDGLVKDTSTATLAPCELTDENVFGACGTEAGEGGFDPFPTSTDLIFVDPGIPPVATDDSAKTKKDTAVTIDIAPNDSAKAPIKTVAITGDAAHGAARLVSTEAPDPTPSTSASSSSSSSSVSLPTGILTLDSRRAAGARTLAAVTSYRAVYTPADGFVGTDSFEYRITTANGSATAKVTVTVTGAAVDASDSSRAVDASSGSRQDLAATGTQSGDLVGYAALLLAAGGGAVALGQKRRRGRHAR